MNMHTHMRLFTFILLVAFVALVGLGLFMPSSNHGEHETGCLFGSGDTVLCAIPLAHMEHWQSAVMMILIEIVLVATFLIFEFLFSLPTKDSQRERYRCAQIRPSLLQELFSDGILNPKAP